MNNVSQRQKSMDTIRFTEDDGLYIVRVCVQRLRDCTRESYSKSHLQPQRALLARTSWRMNETKDKSTCRQYDAIRRYGPFSRQSLPSLFAFTRACIIHVLYERCTYICKLAIHIPYGGTVWNCWFASIPPEREECAHTFPSGAYLRINLIPIQSMQIALAIILDSLVLRTWARL